MAADHRRTCRQMGLLTTECQSLHIERQLFSRVRFHGGFHRHDQISWLAMVIALFKQSQMSTEVRNWDVVAKALEAAGNTSSEMYIRAKALALGKLDPMPTSFPEAPYSISAVAG